MPFSLGSERTFALRLIKGAPDRQHGERAGACPRCAAKRYPQLPMWPHAVQNSQPSL